MYELRISAAGEERPCQGNISRAVVARRGLRGKSEREMRGV